MEYRIKFIAAIKQASAEKDELAKACAEWSFDRIQLPPTTDQCICTHPIQTNYVIKNKTTGVELVVGSECIHNFMSENKELQKDVKKAKKNHKRKLQGKEELMTCTICGKSIAKPSKWCYNLNPYHQSCRKKQINDQLKAERAELLESYVDKKQDMLTRITTLINSEKFSEDNAANYRTKDFLGSIRQYLNEKGYLTEGQESAFLKIEQGKAKSRNKKQKR